MNYYSFHIGDYRRDTGHLSLLEHGIYRQLLDWYYLEEKAIPKETQVVFRRLGARTESESAAIRNVLADFFLLTEEGYVHAHCERVIDAFHAKADTARTNGKLGGRPKKTEVVSDGKPKQTHEKANQEPITNKSKPPKSSASPEGFAEFWSAYPKRIGKGAAEKAWCKASPLETNKLEDLLAAIRIACASEQWRKDGGQFIPNPATWLNQRRWEDELPPAGGGLNGSAAAANPLFQGAI